MIVVSNTSPICYLAWIGEAELLQRFYKEVLITPVVEEELRHPNAPLPVREFMRRIPGWLKVRSHNTPAALLGLHAGEASAIALAIEFRADVLLLDELPARKAAQRLQLTIMGTIGVLAEAHRAGMTDFASCVRKLRQTSFRMSEDMVREAAQRLGVPEQKLLG